VANQLVRDLINAGVHFGHGASRWNPKMAPFIFAKRSNVHIIDVKQTIKSILIAKKMLAEIVASGKDVVFVGTKRQAQKAIEAAAAKCQMHYVSQRWLGGTLTNFRTIRSRLQRLEQIEAMITSGDIEKESKKHASRLKREYKKIKANLEGIRKMSQIPGAIIVVDGRKEYIALAEARKLGIPTIGILDTDSNPDTVDVVIPANDDSIRAVGLILNELADAVSIGKTMAVPQQVQMPRQRKPRSRSVLARAEGPHKRAEAAETMGQTEQPEQAPEPAQPQPTSELDITE
jgi:small subunit ribosomal protein S2